MREKRKGMSERSWAVCSPSIYWKTLALVISKQRRPYMESGSIAAIKNSAQLIKSWSIPRKKGKREMKSRQDQG